MKKENLSYEYLREHIYPWIKESLVDEEAINGKDITDENIPVISFVANLKIIFAVELDTDHYKIVTDKMLPEETNIEELYHKACENLARDIKFAISHTMYGGFGVVADGHHEASALCFKHIWTMCVEQLEEDIIIMVPAKDLILFAPRKNKKVIEDMIIFGKEGYKRNKDKVSRELFLFSRERKELFTYEEEH